MKYFYLIITFVFPGYAFSELPPEVLEIKNNYKPICEQVENAGWSKIEEYQFSKEYMLLELDDLKKAYNSETMSANEGLDDAIMFLKGSALRLDVEYWQKTDNKAAESAKKRFCEFYRKAYYHHQMPNK